MANKALPSPEVLRQRLDYSPETGCLLWKAWSGAPKSWNSRYPGTAALNYRMKNGYLQGALCNVLTTAHRVIWAMQTGSWPQGDIDHINGDRADNRWDNLREATRSQNNKNRRPIAGRSSPYLGVSWSKVAKKWDARIQTDIGQVCLGHFASELEAARAYDAAARKHHGEFARPNFAE